MGRGHGPRGFAIDASIDARRRLRAPTRAISRRAAAAPSHHHHIAVTSRG